MDIATASFDKTAVLWNIKGDQLVKFEGHLNEIKQAEFSRDGQFILTSAEDATAKLWGIDGFLIKTFGYYDAERYISATF